MAFRLNPLSLMIVYLHGFNSSPASSKARQLGEYMAKVGRSDEYFCPLLANSPRDAIAQIKAALLERAPQSITLVGSSLGGFYATYLAEKYDWKAVLVNPAVHVHRLLRNVLGPQTNWYTGERWVLTEDHLAELEALDIAQISQPSRYLLLVQTADEVLDYRDAVSYYADAQQCVEPGGDHGFRGFERYLSTILDF